MGNQQIQIQNAECTDAQVQEVDKNKLVVNAFAECAKTGLTSGVAWNAYVSIRQKEIHNIKARDLKLAQEKAKKAAEAKAAYDASPEGQIQKRIDDAVKKAVAEALSNHSCREPIFTANYRDEK